VTKPAVLFIAVCEFLVGFVLGLFCILFVVVSRTDANDGWKTVAGAVICAMGSLLCVLTGYAMLRRRRWGWYASWVVGVITVAFGCFLVWAAFRPDPTGDGGEVIFLALPILAFALPACWIMLTSNREDFVSGEGS
jgi:hypothetical protein